METGLILNIAWATGSRSHVPLMSFDNFGFGCALSFHSSEIYDGSEIYYTLSTFRCAIHRTVTLDKQ